MKTVYSPDHRLHGDQPEFAGGLLVPCFEKVERAEIVINRIRAVNLGPIVAPEPKDLEAAKRVHAARYVDFLAEAWTLWTAAGRSHPALPSFWRAPGMSTVEPDGIDGKLGYYSFDAGCALVSGSWTAIQAACGSDQGANLVLRFADTALLDLAINGTAVQLDLAWTILASVRRPSPLW